MPIAMPRFFRQWVAAAFLLASMPAFATAQRTFVSGQGNDMNACSVTAPCRSFAAAIAQTIVGGEVIVLDSAGYGPVTITQSVTITAPPGVYAGISVPVTTPNGVFVNAPSGTVLLRGLTINSTGGIYGIYFSDGNALTVERCQISGFAGAGIYQLGGVVMTVRETTIGDNISGFGAVVGQGGSATFDGVSIGRVNTGVEVFGALTMRASTISDMVAGMNVLMGAVVALDGVTISRSIPSGSGITLANYSAGTSVNLQMIRSQIVNSGFGIYAYGDPGSICNVHVTDSLISNNVHAGVTTLGTAVAIVSHATIVGNGIGLNANSSIIYSMQNNEIFNNANPNVGLIFPVSYQ